MTARTVPTSTVSSSGTRISKMVPATGEGTSVSTLSVATSSSGSSTSTVSPTALSHDETVPSVTDSPRAGIVTSAPLSVAGAGGAAGEAVVGAGAAAGAGEEGAGVAASEGCPMTARTVPTSTVSSSGTRISKMVPATGEGTSVSTLSVATSSSGSSTSTVSPTALSHDETVPSVTDSPRAGIFTDSDMVETLYLFAISRDCAAACRRGPWRPLQ